MEKYPKEVITKNRKDEEEVRCLVARGRFILYEYRDPKTFKIMENGKKKLYLKGDDGSEQVFYIIPTKTVGRDLLLKTKDDEKKISVWNNNKKTIEDLF